MDIFPSDLPQTFLAGVSVTDDESRLTTQMDAGPSSVRNRFTAITQTIKGGMILTGSEMTIFDTFFRTTLQHGSLSFTWTHPVTGESATMRFKKKPEWVCMRSASTASARLWKGEFELEAMP
jgi:hypothetical protein